MESRISRNIPADAVFCDMESALHPLYNCSYKKNLDRGTYRTVDLLRKEVMYRTCDEDGDGMTLEESFIYFVNLVVRFPDYVLDNHIKSFVGNSISLEEVSRVVSIDEFYFMHLETLTEDLATLNKVLCDEYNWCRDFAPFPKENGSGKRMSQEKASKPFVWPQELAVLVVSRFPCMFGGEYGYSSDPSHLKPVKHQTSPQSAVTKEQVRQCTQGLHHQRDKAGLFQLRLPRSVKRANTTGHNASLPESQLAQFGLDKRT